MGLRTIGALLLVAQAAHAEERFALIIGANAGWADDRPLKHAESDADSVAQVLRELGQFPAERITLLKDPDTLQVRGELARIVAASRGATGPSLVFVYYSGHADERHLHLRGEKLSFEELYQTLRDAPATVRVGVFDACRSGAILAAKGGAPVMAFDVNVVDELTVHGLALLTSSGADELSQERRALQGSVFTHHFVSALRGAADLDMNGQITLSEAYRYAYDRTDADTAATVVPQRPAFRYELKGQGELVMTWPAQAKASLVLPRSGGERFIVVDDAERRVVAEGRSEPERDLSLALPAGEYRVKHVLSDRIQVARLSLADGVQVKASLLTYASQPLSSGLVKGDLGVEVHHPRKAFWGLGASALATAALWAGAGLYALSLHNADAQLARPLTPGESSTLSGWSLTSDIALAVTVILAVVAVITW